MDRLHLVAHIVSSRGVDNDVDELARLVDGDDAWEAAIQTAIEQGMGPVLLRRMQMMSIGPQNNGLLAPLYAERNKAAVYSVMASRVRALVQEALVQAGVSCVWLKGVVLAESVYASPELRPMVDIDVLVPRSERERALLAVEQMGFTLETPQLFDGRSGIKHHYYLASRLFDPVRLELHFRLLGTMDSNLMVEEQEWFWHHVNEVEGAEGRTLIALSPQAHLLYLCAHFALQHGEADMRLLRLYDVDRLLESTPAFEWDILLDGAVRMRWTYAVERTLTLANEYFGTPVPYGILTRCAKLRPIDEEVGRLVRRQSSWTKTEAVVQDLAAMGWADRMRATGRIVFPPPHYMRWRYGLSSNSGLPGAYVRRIGQITSDVIYSIRRKTQHSR